MIGAYATLVVLVAASVVVGLALLALLGRREATWMAAAPGLAVLLATGGIATGLADGAGVIAGALLGVVVASVAILVVRRPEGLGGLAAGLPAALVAVLFASLPFIAAGRVGILGVGLVNDDMASHLLMASWLGERFTPEPVLIHQGYPLGPHALAAAFAEGFGTGLIEVFAGLTLAIPALLALTAHAALERLAPVWRTLAAAATALPYLLAAYLAQEAFKEPIMALLLLATALWLPRVERARDGAVLGVLAAGTIYVYSFPGLVWLVGTAAVWGAIELFRRRGEVPLGTSLRRAAGPVALAAVVALALAALDFDRLRDFADFRALDPDKANEGGLGNLGGHLSPLEALGIWPTSEFRLSAGAGGLPAAAFYAGALISLLALSLGLPRWIRDNGWALPSALATALVVYVGARAFGTVYTSAKALAILTPLIVLVALGGLLRGAGVSASEDIGGGRRRMRRRRRRPSDGVDTPAPLTTALAVLVLAGLAMSSFLVLRQAPVGPEDHADELAEFRPIVEGEPVLFLGRDNFVLYELRGSRPFTHVRNFYDPYFVKPNFEIENVASKFDFDSVTADKLPRFSYVITTRAAYGSGPPVGYVPVLTTDSYILWKARGDPRSRLPVETGPPPSGELRCGKNEPRQAALMAAKPIALPASAWSSQTIESGEEASASVDLPDGDWYISLRYDSTRPVTVSTEDGSEELPGNLDYRGVAPPWAAGEVKGGGPVTITATVERPPVAGRLMGAHSVAHLGEVSFVQADTGYVSGADAPFPGVGATLRVGSGGCGREADWVEAPR